MTNAFFKVTKKIASGSNSFRSYKPPFGQLPPFANPVRQRQQTVFSCVGPNNFLSLNTLFLVSVVQPPGSATKGLVPNFLLLRTLVAGRLLQLIQFRSRRRCYRAG